MGKQKQGWRERIFGGGKERELENKLHELHSNATSEPNNPRWHHKLGETYRRLGRSRKSILSYYRAAELYSEDGFVLKAIAMCKMILDQDPHHQQTQEMLAAFSQARQSEEKQDLLIVGLSAIKRPAHEEATQAQEGSREAPTTTEDPPSQTMKRASLSLKYDDINNLDAIKADVLQQSAPEPVAAPPQDDNEEAALAFLMEAFHEEVKVGPSHDSQDNPVDTQEMAPVSPQTTEKNLKPVTAAEILNDIDVIDDNTSDAPSEDDVLMLEEEVNILEEDINILEEEVNILEEEVNIVDEDDLLELDPMAALEDAVSEVILDLNVEDLISAEHKATAQTAHPNIEPEEQAAAQQEPRQELPFTNEEPPPTPELVPLTEDTAPSIEAEPPSTQEDPPSIQKAPSPAAALPFEAQPPQPSVADTGPFQPKTLTDDSGPFQRKPATPAPHPVQQTVMEEKTALMTNPFAVLDPFVSVETGVAQEQTSPEMLGITNEEAELDYDPGEQTSPNLDNSSLTPPPSLQAKFLPPKTEMVPAWVEKTQIDVQLSQLLESDPLDSLQLGKLVAQATQLEQTPSPTSPGRVYEIPINESFEDSNPSSDQLLQQIAPIPLFSSLPVPVLQMLLAESSYFELEPGEVIIQQGYLDTSLFVLIDGEIAVYHEGPQRQELARLGDGAFFGEIALISDEPRSATVEATRESCVLEISREMIGRLVQHYPNVLQLLLRFFRERLLQKLIDTSNLFAQFSGSERYRLMQRFAFLEAEPHCELIQENTPGEALYIMLTGRASIETSRSGQPQQIATVGPGDVFGEIALLFDQPTTATVRTLKKCWLLRLDRALFQQQLLEQPRLHSIINQLALHRTQQLRELFSYEASHLPLY